MSDLKTKNKTKKQQKHLVWIYIPMYLGWCSNRTGVSKSAVVHKVTGQYQHSNYGNG